MKGTLVVLLLVAAVSLAGTVGGARASVASSPADASNLTLQVNLAVYNATTNQSVPVSQTLGAVIFLNASAGQAFDNFTLSNNGNYTTSDFGGFNLSSISTVLVDAYAPPRCGCSDVQQEFDNLSGTPTLSLNAVFEPNGTSIGVLLPPPNTGPAASPFPLFLQLVGVGVLATLAYFVVVGLRKLLAPFAGSY